MVTSVSWTDSEKLTRTAALAARKGDAVLVMGGDGMAHLGLNACAGTDATLGIIPAGTGNDFARGVGVPKELPGAIDAICVGATRRVDLSHISNEAYPSRYVGAVLSTGYDARVNRATNDISLRFGSLSYGWIALRELVHFSPLQYRLRIDGVLRIQEAMIVAVCNTGMFGGGTPPTACWTSRSSIPSRAPPSCASCRRCTPEILPAIHPCSSSGPTRWRSPGTACSAWVTGRNWVTCR